MPIHQAANQVSSLFLGDKQIVAAYKGTELVFSAGLTQNIYVFDISLISSGSRTITLNKSLRGDITSNPITDWGDGTKDNLLTHTYSEDGVYVVKSKYGINGTRLIETTVNNSNYYKSLDYSLEINDYDHVVSIPNNSEQAYVRVCGPEDELCIDYYTATVQPNTYLGWDRTDKFGNTANSAYGALRNESGHFHQLEEESLNFCAYGADCTTGIYPIYFIYESTGTTLDGAVLTPGVWYRRQIGNSVSDLRFSGLSWYNLTTTPLHCIGNVDTREALVEVQGINHKQNTLINMYCLCENLKTVNISESKNWNFKNINSLEFMFKSCTSLEWFDINQWNLSTVENVTGMFEGATIKPLITHDNSITFIADDYWASDREYLEYKSSGSYSHYYKIADGYQIPDDSYLFGAGYLTYYDGVFAYTAGNNEPRTYEEFDAFTYEVKSEEQDGVTKELYILRIENGTTFALITRTGFYDSARDVEFSPGIWFFCDNKAYSVHANIYMGKELCFYGPEIYTISYDPDTTEILESFTVSGSSYYKILEEVPENKYLQGSGVIYFYNTDSPDLQSYEFDVGTFTYDQDHFEKMYCTINTNGNAGYTLLTITTTGWYPNAGVKFTPGVWVSPYYNGENPRYFVSITFNGDGEDDWIGDPYYS